MLITEDWQDFEIIDTGGGEKLERWGKYILRRPDPQVIWPISNNKKTWDNADAHYIRSQSGGGEWQYKKRLPKRWEISYDKISMYVEPTGFKHTGIFPEQAVNWKWIIEKIKTSSRQVKVLNLFAYTGGATVAAALAGAEVCHVDASKGMVSRAKGNLELSGLSDKPVRFITDDVIKFVQREIRRGNLYDAVIMDPPAYGRGPGGELWKIEDELYDLVRLCTDVFCKEPLFFIINAYTTGLAPSVLKNILMLLMKKKFGGNVSGDEIGLPVTESGIVLPCGATGKWENW
ncbi:MAG: class I SAM-dependent methyltransferase [Clostridia bacterium]|jgi:23S rRNA (cytosine1962-C5)-methyltransferase